jgi:hypothetical protein
LIEHEKTTIAAQRFCDAIAVAGDLTVIVG